MKKGLWTTMMVVLAILFAFSASQAKPFKIAAIFQTAIEEPWDGVIHQACLQAKKEMGNIEYEFTERRVTLSNNGLPQKRYGSLSDAQSRISPFINII